MKGYLILHFNLNNPKLFEKYKETAGPILKRYIAEGKAKLLVNASSSTDSVKEGLPRDITQVIQFESPEIANEFYNLEAYRETISYRTSSTDGWVLLTEGV